MEYSLKNQFLEVKIASLGAELISMKDLKTNEEYIWQKTLNFGLNLHLCYFLL